MNHDEVGRGNLARSQESALRLLSKWLPEPDLRERLVQDMKKTGWDHHVGLRVLLARLGEASREDRPGRTGGLGQAPGRKSDGDALFGDMFSAQT